MKVGRAKAKMIARGITGLLYSLVFLSISSNTLAQSASSFAGATYDSTVNIQHSEDLVKALEKAGKSVEFLELYGAHTHDTRSRKSRTKYLEKLESFLYGVFPDNDRDAAQTALP